LYLCQKHDDRVVGFMRKERDKKEEASKKKDASHSKKKEITKDMVAQWF
jgi:hypothetical protein